MKVVFFGTPEFAVPALAALIGSKHRVVCVAAQPDRPAGRGMKLQKPPVAQLAIEASIPLMQPEKIRNEEFLDAIRGFGPDLGVVVAYGKILPQALLDVPRHGFVNVHASLLPKYRGAAPIQRAIQNGEAVTGVTIMRVDAELDHGPVFAMQSIPIGTDERTPSLAAKLAEAGGPLLLETIDRLEAGTAVESEQKHELATYAAKIEKSEGEVRWEEPARRIYDRFRAFDPWPGVSATVGGERVKILEMSVIAAEGEAEEEGGAGPDDLPLEMNARRQSPGTVVGVERDAVVVAAGAGAVRITKIQRPGKRASDPASLLRSRGMKSGDRLE
ncbi:MAG: methionyl-tRNA formyltransferase [Thermoanaerobaculia bacterium]